MALTKQEEKILESIIVASENDPDKPEFPPDDPKFPATPTYKIEVPEFSNVWLGLVQKIWQKSAKKSEKGDT